MRQEQCKLLGVKDQISTGSCHPRPGRLTLPLRNQLKESTYSLRTYSSISFNRNLESCSYPGRIVSRVSSEDEATRRVGRGVCKVMDTNPDRGARATGNANAGEDRGTRNANARGHAVLGRRSQALAFRPCSVWCAFTLYVVCCVLESRRRERENHVPISRISQYITCGPQEVGRPLLSALVATGERSWERSHGPAPGIVHTVLIGIHCRTSDLFRRLPGECRPMPRYLGVLVHYQLTWSPLPLGHLLPLLSMSEFFPRVCAQRLANCEKCVPSSNKGSFKRASRWFRWNLV